MRKPIRFPLLLALGALAAPPVFAQQVGINANGAVPHPNAMLDLDVSSLPAKRGLLIPRMTEAERLAIPVIPTEDNSLLVYQTDVGAANDLSNGRGFWYYSEPAGTWLHLSNVRRGWSLWGNNVQSTGATPEFLGTVAFSNNLNLVMRTALAPANPAFQMGYDLFDYRAGYVGLGTAAAATERLEVEGAIYLSTNGTPAAHVAAPIEGSIRYGTLDGALPNSANLKYHWGATDSINSGGPYWRRLENAETLELTPEPYPKDTIQCAGDIGDALRGQLSTVPVTGTSASPVNIYSPFATNGANGGQRFYRAQYLYRHAELVAAGLCFEPNATISAIAFFSLDQDYLGDGTPGDPAVTITGEIRGGVPSNPTLQDPTSGAFGPNNTAPYMDDNIRTSAVRNSFTTLTVGPGWINFPLSPAITVAPGQNLILDIVWSRNAPIGVGPKVELEDPGFNCTKWLYAPSGVTASPAGRMLMDDNPLSPGPAIVAPVGSNPHNRRPVTRFTATVQTADVVQRQANYLWYDGGVMVGSNAWLGTQPRKGPGTVQAENGVFDGNVRLSDHVFDRYFDGTVRPEDAASAEGYVYVGLDRLRERLAKDRHLPNMPSRSAWEAKGGASLGAVTTGLWQSVEDQALYISQLEQDLSALEELAFGPALAADEAQQLIARINASKRLTDAQKLHLTNALKAKANPSNAKP